MSDEKKDVVPSLVGDGMQKLAWHVQGLRMRLEGALALMEAFPSLSPAAQQEVINMLQRGMR